MSSFELLMRTLAMGRKRKPARQERIDKRMAKRLCIDDSDGCDCNRSCDEPGGAGGRCSMHRARLTRECMNRTPEEKLAIYAKHEREGTLISAAEGRRHARLSRRAAS